MNKELQTVFHYHETTKHAQQRYARSLGYMDWASQPDPFRNYNGCETIELPIALENATPPYHLLNTDLPPAPLLKESLSQLLQFSMGIAAHKESGGSSWAVRCNASSGNLHPTESYLVLPPIMEEQNTKTSILHYTPQNHGLEKLSEFDTSFWDNLPKGSFLLGLSGITWREVWKYGERAFRYTNLDAGHAWQSIVVSAKMLGWKVTRLDSTSDTDIGTLFGLNQKTRFFEHEHADMLFVVSPSHVESSLRIDSLLENVPLSFNGIANKLSSQMQSWDIIPAIENATSVMQIAQQNTTQNHMLKDATQESKTVVLNRRSIHIMHTDTSTITQEEFHTILSSVNTSLDAKENAVHLALMVHRVEGYKKGLYILVRNDRDLINVQEHMHNDFLWNKTELNNLYFLEEKDVTMASKSISCSQDIASDGAFSLGMLCNFSEQLNAHGAHRYKELYWECGMIGQELYLEATSLGLSGTGIGCFLDDMMHGMLGIKDTRFQVLYHFTIGRGNVDSRIMTKPAYNRK
ncbi:nitroreductase family protein [Sulfurimonas sp. SAG-AH-194-I05]|nr:nitroreductase family protein [Sulfurimonas sp. SAG-AH-194-I05]MDF1875966.1 nitroreductase family protein [Sulfurimonas sp. SAG-AH-194-I05]